MEAILQWIAEEEQKMFSKAWSVAMLRETLQYDYNHIFVAYEEHGSLVCLPVADCKTQTSNLRGYMIVNEVADTSELLRIGVTPTYRKCGCATCLMQYYFEHIHCGQYMLEVRVSNRNARKLYEKFSYKRIGTRKNYYSDPTEDGMIYQRIV